MNGVLGMARLLKQTSMTEEQWEYVKAISQSGETLLNIVNDILDVSKIGKKKKKKSEEKEERKKLIIN